MEIKDFTVNYSAEDRGETIGRLLKEYGVVVVSDVFSAERCNQEMTRTLSQICKISPEVKLGSMKEIEETWTRENLMPQTRSGLFQNGYSFLSWPIRSAPEVVAIFQEAYTALRGEPVVELVSSLDAINIRPPIKPFTTPSAKDWAHIDQTLSDNPYECVQGQVVLTNTTAAFRCSPKSHLIYKDLLKSAGKLGNKANWFKIPEPTYRTAREMLDKVDGEWQKVIQVPRGSVILWLSSVIHSAVMASKESKRTQINPQEPWDQWRGVFYVCHRPKSEVSEEHIRQLQTAFKDNRTTNHWGNKLFATSLPTRFMSMTHYNETIQKYIKNPSAILKLEEVDAVEQTDNLNRLIGRADWD